MNGELIFCRICLSAFVCTTWFLFLISAFFRIFIAYSFSEGLGAGWFTAVLFLHEHHFSEGAAAEDLQRIEIVVIHLPRRPPTILPSRFHVYVIPIPLPLLPTLMPSLLELQLNLLSPHPPVPVIGVLHAPAEHLPVVLVPVFLLLGAAHSHFLNYVIKAS